MFLVQLQQAMSDQKWRFWTHRQITTTDQIRTTTDQMTSGQLGHTHMFTPGINNASPKTRSDFIHFHYRKSAFVHLYRLYLIVCSANNNI